MQNSHEKMTMMDEYRRARREACEGQIVRLERRDARAAWVLHVVESEPDIERDEGAVEDMKLELR